MPFVSHNRDVVRDYSRHCAFDQIAFLRCSIVRQDKDTGRFILLNQEAAAVHSPAFSYRGIRTPDIFRGIVRPNRSRIDKL